MSTKIGIPGWSIGDNTFGVTRHYLDFVSQFGNPVIIMPRDEEVKVDALLLPGGADLNPSVYGEVPSFYAGNPNVHNQFFFDKRLPMYVEADIPIFGICLGFQQINAFFKGKLVQHLTWHPTSSDRFRQAHKVFQMFPNGLLDDSQKKDNERGMYVNSHHHQAVLLSTLSEELKPLLFAHNVDTDPKDFVVEAFQHRTRRIAGVQWHPEEWYDDDSRILFNEILQ